MPSYPSDQLAFHLPFDEVTGINVKDVSYTGRNFLIQGNDLARVTGPYLYTGLYGYTGYTFTGPYQCTGMAIGGQGPTGLSYIEAENSSTGDVSTGNFSLACWIRPRCQHPTAPLNNYSICSKTADTSYPSFEFGLEHDQWYCYVSFFVDGLIETLFAQNTHTLHEDSWMHIAITVQRLSKGILVKFYQNGIFHNADYSRGIRGPYTSRSLSNTGRFMIFKTKEEFETEYGHHIIADMWFFNNRLLSDQDVYDIYKVLG